MGTKRQPMLPRKVELLARAIGAGELVVSLLQGLEHDREEVGLVGGELEKWGGEGTGGSAWSGGSMDGE